MLQFHDYKALQRGSKSTGNTRDQEDVRLYKDKNKELLHRIKGLQEENKDLKEIIKGLKSKSE